jgi:outer membrane protein
MKKLLSITCLIFLLLFNFGNANTKIAFVDMDKIMSTSNPGVSILSQLKNINKKNSDTFNNKKKLFKEKEDKIVSQKNILTEEEFQLNVNKLRLEIAEYNKDRNKIISEFNKIKVDNSNKLLKLISPILTKYSEEKEISIILQKKNLIIGKRELDITNDIIKLINNNIKEFKIK